MPLTSQQTRYLRGLTHHLQPVVTVAEKGLSENVRAEIENALGHHELVKIRLCAERGLRRQWVGEIIEDFGAEPVHIIGQVASFFRRNEKKPVIALPDQR